MAKMDSKEQEAPFDPTESGLKYYIFDWDDNVLQMPTEIILEKKQNDGSWITYPVTTSTFALVRNDTDNYRAPNNDWESAFVNFRDLQENAESTFLSDTRTALQNVISGKTAYAPSFQVFKDTLIDGRLFAIVTARGHKAKSIQEAVRYFIFEVLSEDEFAQMIRNLRGYFKAFGKESEENKTDREVLDYYLHLNRYHGVTCPDFQKNILGHEGEISRNPEEAKKMAIRDFVHHVISLVSDGKIDRKISIGFSDDDLGNVAAAKNYIETVLSKEFPYVTFVVFDTSDPKKPYGKKTILQGQLELDFDDDPS